jgi:hypothetical protein
MAKSYISDRIIFKNYKTQWSFILGVKDKLNLSWQEMAKIAGVHNRTLRDWARKDLKMPYSVAIDFSIRSGIKLPKNIKHQKWTDHLKSISKKGGIENLRQNKNIGGNKEYREKRWRNWWGEFGKHKKYKIFERKNINTPKQGKMLAEFVGIMLGDGGVAPYHISITLNADTDKDFVKFVNLLIFKLFKIRPKNYRDRNSKALDIIVHRKSLVEFCQKIGLKIGNKIKQGLNIPKWILDDSELIKSCIRGLIDTDGSLFIHSYKVRGKIYSYPKISFTSVSPDLIKTVHQSLIKLGFNVRISRSGKDVFIENMAHVAKYFEIFGSNNEKHWVKYKNWKVAPNGKAAVC